MSIHSPVLRYIALATGIAGTLFWVYTFYWISKVPPGDGTGFQWLAEVPLTAIFIFLTFPAIALATSSRTSWLATISGILNLAAFAVLWAPADGGVRTIKKPPGDGRRLFKIDCDRSEATLLNPQVLG
jgi:hypothetical protein